VKILTGETGRVALYALAATTGEVVISLGGDRNEVEALASAGARRTRRDNVPMVLVIKDPAAFADAVGRLSWKRMPAQILIDGSRVAQ
jgi:hypothetical protein